VRGSEKGFLGCVVMKLRIICSAVWQLRLEKLRWVVWCSTLTDLAAAWGSPPPLSVLHTLSKGTLSSTKGTCTICLRIVLAEHGLKKKKIEDFE
jgi:hypothetical protein